MELDYSPEALQKRLDYLDDNRLERNGTHIIDKDQIQTDGPFLETKEID